MSREGGRRQEAYHNLSDLVSEADELLHDGVHNEKQLRHAFAEAEDLLFDLDRIECELIEQIERAEDQSVDAATDRDGGEGS